MLSLGLGLGIAAGTRSPQFTDLFGDGRDGFALQAWDHGGTTGVERLRNEAGTPADWGEGVRTIFSLTPPGRDALQSSAAAQPVAGRRPTVLGQPGEVVTSAFNITNPSLPNNAYVGFNGTSQSTVVGPFASGFSGSVAFITASGIYVVTGVSVAAAGSLTLGPINGPAGTLNLFPTLPTHHAIIGIAGGFTAADLARVQALAVSRGLPGLLVAGAEIVTNGTFDTNTAGWTAINAAALSSVSGRLEVAGNGGSDDSADQNFTAAVDGVYRVSADYIGGTSNGRIVISHAALNFGVVVSTPGTYTFLFRATSAPTTIRLFQQSGSAGTAIYDNVSIKRLTPAA